MSNFECCIPCKPPKRYPGCHDDCMEYQKCKAINAADKARRHAESRVDSYVRRSVIRMKSKAKGINHHAK